MKNAEKGEYTRETTLSCPALCTCFCFVVFCKCLGKVFEKVVNFGNSFKQFTDPSHSHIFRHSYSNTGENNELMKLSHHKKSCRVLRFSPSGEELHTASKDQSFNTVDLNTGTLKRRVKNAHE